MAQKKPAVQDNGFEVVERRLGVDVQRLDTCLVKLDFKLEAEQAKPERQPLQCRASFRPDQVVQYLAMYL